MAQHQLFAANYNAGAQWVYDRLEQWLAERDIDFVKAVCKTDDDVIEQARNADIYLAYQFPVTRRVLESLPNLKLLMSSGSGYDHIDVEAARDRGITVTNTALYNIEDVAEFAVLLIMASLRKLRRCEHLVREGKWQIGAMVQPTHRNLSQVVGLIGFGHIGHAIAWRLKALGFRVLAADPYVSSEEIIKNGAEPVTLDTLLRESDVVSPHLRVTDETYHLMNEAAFAKMKPTAAFVNTSRGRVVDEAALIAALQSGQISGAALDVLEVEPPELSNPLLNMENVIVTGHTAGSSVEGIEDWQQEWRQIISAFVSGQPIPNVVV